MGAQELIESLRREGEDAIRRLRQEAEKKAAAAKEEAAGRIASARETVDTERALAVKRHAAGLMGDARAEAMRIRLGAEQELAARLLRLASPLLATLRDQDGEVFAALAGELPSFRWTTVRAHPDDEAAARERFPGAEFIPDGRVAGGMAVGAEEDRIIVDNTLDTRLAKAWDDMLPLLFSDAYRAARNHEPAHEH